MTILNDDLEIAFPEGFDQDSELELPVKGYLDDVSIRLAGGTEYLLNFIDPIRLGQELDLEAGSGRPFYATTNLVVLPEVTRASIREVVHRLFLEGYFEKVKPLGDGVPHMPPAALLDDERMVLEFYLALKTQPDEKMDGARPCHG